jgi:hypothetical protein
MMRGWLYDSNSYKYSIRRNHGHCCDVYYSLFNVHEQKMNLIVQVILIIIIIVIIIQVFKWYK